jgi:hypothetical protein
MAGKTRKCQWCKEQGSLDSMVVEMVGNTKPVRKFYHNNCHVKYLEDKAFKEHEAKELDKLTETIKRIYGVKELPRTAFTLLQNLRNGEPVFGKRQQIGKRYKQGYTYSLIEETFDHCSDTIEYWNGVKSFDGFMGAFKYALTIVIDKIYFVEQRAVERAKKQNLIEKHIAETQHEEQEFESSYKKKTSNTDITDFLDD